MRHLLCPGRKAADVVFVLFPFATECASFNLKTGHDPNCCHPAAYSAAKLPVTP